MMLDSGIKSLHYVIDRCSSNVSRIYDAADGNLIELHTATVNHVQKCPIKSSGQSKYCDIEER